MNGTFGLLRQQADDPTVASTNVVHSRSDKETPRWGKAERDRLDWLEGQKRCRPPVLFYTFVTLASLALMMSLVMLCNR